MKLTTKGLPWFCLGKNKKVLIHETFALILDNCLLGHMHCIEHFISLYPECGLNGFCFTFFKLPAKERAYIGIIPHSVALTLR